MICYLLDTIRVISFAGQPPWVVKKWESTYDSQEDAEAAFAALSDKYEVLAAALYEWRGAARDQTAMHNHSWSARSASQGITLTVIAHGDRTYLDNYITAARIKDRNTYITLDDWAVVRPQGMTSHDGGGFNLSIRETPEDIADLIRRGVCDTRNAGLMTAHYDSGPTVPAGHRQPRAARTVTADELETLRATERNVVVETVDYTPAQIAAMPLIKDYLDQWRHKIPLHPEGFFV